MQEERDTSRSGSNAGLILEKKSRIITFCRLSPNIAVVIFGAAMWTCPGNKDSWLIFATLPHLKKMQRQAMRHAS